jgi:hypothetical protein
MNPQGTIVVIGSLEQICSLRSLFPVYSMGSALIGTDVIHWITLQSRQSYTNFGHVEQDILKMESIHKNITLKSKADYFTFLAQRYALPFQPILISGYSTEAINLSKFYNLIVCQFPPSKVEDLNRFPPHKLLYRDAFVTPILWETARKKKFWNRVKCAWYSKLVDEAAPAAVGSTIFDESFVFSDLNRQANKDGIISICPKEIFIKIFPMFVDGSVIQGNLTAVEIDDNDKKMFIIPYKTNPLYIANIEEDGDIQISLDPSGYTAKFVTNTSENQTVKGRRVHPVIIIN